MKLWIALITAAVLAGTVALADDGSQTSTNAGSADGCSTSCDLTAHKAATQGGPAHQMVADDMQSMPGMQPGTQSGPTSANQTMSAMSSMTQAMVHGHMQMTPARTPNAQDRARAAQILTSLRSALEPYRDYRVAEAAGFVPFHPEWPLPMYHFTSRKNALANEFSFDAGRPTSLMYKRVPGGYELEGAMYTAPRRSTYDELDARVPLSIATWHEHTNLCVPPVGEGAQAFGAGARFGLSGSITTADACAQAGGTFIPVIYNWMVHVWPFETDPHKVWATADEPGSLGH